MSTRWLKIIQSCLRDRGLVKKTLLHDFKTFFSALQEFENLTSFLNAFKSVFYLYLCQVQEFVSTR